MQHFDSKNQGSLQRNPSKFRRIMVVCQGHASRRSEDENKFHCNKQTHALFEMPGCMLFSKLMASPTPNQHVNDVDIPKHYVRTHRIIQMV
jgi:hypothetical protein